MMPRTKTCLALYAVASLAACSQYQSQPANVAPAIVRTAIYPEWFRPHPHGNGLASAGIGEDAMRRQHIAVAQFGASEIFWFPLNDRKDRSPAPCEAASSTNGIAIDRRHNLWVPNGKTDTVTEYAPGCGAAKLTISDTTGEPADIGFHSGDVYVLNLNDISGPPTVEIYDASSGKHVGTLSDPSFNDLFGIGTDTLGNVYVSNLTTSNVGTVVEFSNGKMPGTQLSAVSLGLPGAPAFDRNNNLIITDWEGYTIDVFAPPYTGSPTTATLKGASIWCKLSNEETHLYCGDADNGSIDVYGYPSLAYHFSYTAGLSASELVTGVAPDPPSAYK